MSTQQKWQSSPIEMKMQIGTMAGHCTLAKSHSGQTSPFGPRRRRRTVPDCSKRASDTQPSCLRRHATWQPVALPVQRVDRTINTWFPWWKLTYLNIILLQVSWQAMSNNLGGIGQVHGGSSRLGGHGLVLLEGNNGLLSGLADGLAGGLLLVGDSSGLSGRRDDVVQRFVQSSRHCNVVLRASCDQHSSALIKTTISPMADSKDTIPAERQAKVDEILKLKADTARLLSNVRDQKTVAEKYSYENQYLQDYIGSVMSTKDIK